MCVCVYVFLRKRRMNRNVDEGCGSTFPNTFRINREPTNKKTTHKSTSTLGIFGRVSLSVCECASFISKCFSIVSSRHYLDERRFFKWISFNGILSLRNWDIYIYIASKEGREGENKLTEVAYCVCVFLCVLIGFVSLLLYLLIFSATFCMRLRCCKKTSVYRASVNWFLFPVRDVSWQNGHFCVGASCAQFAFLSFFPLAFWFITHFWYRAISFFLCCRSLRICARVPD